MNYLELVYSGKVSEKSMIRHGSIAQWFEAQPKDVRKHASCLELVGQYGTQEQIVIILDVTAYWLEAHPEDAAVHFVYLGLVEHHGTNEQVKEALNVTRNWLEISSTDVQVRAAYLRLVSQRGNIDELQCACVLIQYWLDHNPHIHNQKIFAGYGWSLYKLQRYEDALVQFRRALDITKTDVSIQIGIAWSLYYIERKDEALQELKKIKNLAEKRNTGPIGRILHQLGRYYLLEGDLQAAMVHFRQAISDSDNNYGNYWELGRALFAQGQYADALAAFEKARERLPNNINDESRANLQELIEMAMSKL